MSIVINSIDKVFEVTYDLGEEKVVLGFKQLNYKTKALITSLVTGVNNGQFTHDSTLQVFFNIKYALKYITGVKDEDGNDYKLKFTDASNNELEDSCVDELLAASFSDSLQYTAHALVNSVLPDVILHPLTKQPLKGVSVEVKKGGVRKK